MQISIQAANNILVVTSLTFILALAVWMWFHAPMAMYNMRSMLKKYPDYKFDKSRIPLYLKSLLIIAAASALFGVLITRHMQLVWEFIGLNTGFGAIGLMNGILYHYSDPKRDNTDKDAD